MPTARLHDDSVIDVTVLGDGPAVLLPIGVTPGAGPAAEQARAWGGDPDLGHTLATGLVGEGYRVIAADYETHRMAYPSSRTLEKRNVTADLLAVADAAAEAQFVYYGYSWLASAGLQLALESERVTALAMGGFPPVDGPYAAMLTVTRAAHRQANRPPEPAKEVTPGDWENATVTQSPEQTGQFVTLYESLADFDDRAALGRLTIPRLVFAGETDNIVYPPKWGGTRVAIAEPVIAARAELERHGWTVEIVRGADHLSAMQGTVILPILLSWLRQTGTDLTARREGRQRPTTT